MSRQPSELTKRVLSALVMAAAALATLWIGGLVFAAFWAAAAAWIWVEWLAMTTAPARRVRMLAGIAGILAVAAALLFAPGWTVIAGAAAILAQLVLPGPRAERGWGVLGLIYAGVVVVAVIIVRNDPALGMAGIAWMFAVVWTSDIAAFFTGRALGGPKLMPSVSPKKTWSGFIGGLIAATIAGIAVGWAAARYGQQPMPLAALAILSAAASIAGQAGDLAESALKRRAGVKDSGSTIPGHGGIMDRLDAFCAVAFIVLAALALRHGLAG